MTTTVLDYPLIRQTVRKIYRVMLGIHPDTAAHSVLLSIDPRDPLAFQRTPLGPEARDVVEGDVYQTIWLAASLTESKLQEHPPTDDVLGETAHSEIFGQLAMSCYRIVQLRNDDMLAVVHGASFEALGSVLRQIEHILTTYFAPGATMSTRIQFTGLGDSEFKQGLTLWWARHRPALLRSLRCASGKHNPPANEAFNAMGAVMAGGPCTRCDDETPRPICWLGNAWDLPGVSTSETSEGGTKYTVSPTLLARKLAELGFRYTGSCSD